jgi:hypothetical protein
MFSAKIRGFTFAFVKLDCEGGGREIIEWICANLAHLLSHLAIGCQYHHWSPVRRDQILENVSLWPFR